MIYRPIRRSCITGEISEYGPTFSEEDAAHAWIEDYERLHGCEPGCDGGFGVGSGFDVEVKS